jgi:hypothetical protein
MASNLIFPPQLDSDALVNSNLGASIYTPDNGLVLVGNMAASNSKRNAAVTITNLNALNSVKLLSIQNGPLTNTGAVGGATQEVLSVDTSGNVTADGAVNIGAGLGLHVNLNVITSSATSGAPYVVLNTDCVLEVNAHGTAFIQLPAASSVATGQVFIVKNVSSTTDLVTVSVASSGHIDAATTKGLNTGYGALRIFGDGTTYWTW